MKNLPSVIVAVYSSLISLLVVYIQISEQINPTIFTIFAVTIALISWLALLKKLSPKISYIILAISWLMLATEYYYLGYSKQDIATSLGQQSDNIKTFNFIIIPIAILVNLSVYIVARKTTKK